LPGKKLQNEKNFGNILVIKIREFTGKINEILAKKIYKKFSGGKNFDQKLKKNYFF